MGKYYGTDAIPVQDTAAFSESRRHFPLKPLAILGLPIVRPGFILYSLVGFGGERGLSESSGSRNNGWSGKLRFIYTKKKSDRSE